MKNENVINQFFVLDILSCVTKVVLAMDSPVYRYVTQQMMMMIIVHVMITKNIIFVLIMNLKCLTLFAQI